MKKLISCTLVLFLCLSLFSAGAAASGEMAAEPSDAAAAEPDISAAPAGTEEPAAESAAAPPALDGAVLEGDIYNTSLHWKLDNGTLTVTGTGQMADLYAVGNNLPWRSYAASLERIVIGEGVTTIARNAFADCTRLSEITLPSTIQTIDLDAFQYCSSLRDVFVPDLASWSKIEILHSDASPLYYADHLYVNGELLTDLVVKADSEMTGNNFWYYRSLRSVVFENGAADKFSSFCGCTALENAVLCDGIQTIGPSSFRECANLRSVTIPASVTKIDSGAFADCPRLQEVIYEGTPEQWASIDIRSYNDDLLNAYAGPVDGECGPAASWRFTTDGKLVLSGSGAVTSTPWTKYSKSIRSLVIEEGVTTLPRNAFSRYTALETVSIPKSLTRIEGSAFSECSSLKRVDITDLSAWCGISFSNRDSNPLSHAQTLSLNGNPVESVEIPDGCETIQNYTFAGCSWLRQLSIPSSITKIGEGAFYGCSGLQAIEYAGSPEQWVSVNVGTGNDYVVLVKNGEMTGECGENARWRLDAYGTLRISGTGDISFSTYTAPWASAGDRVRTVVIEDGITAIPRACFFSSNNVETAYLPGSLVRLGGSVFRSLRELHITDLAAWCKIESDYDQSFAESGIDQLYVGDSLVTSLTLPSDIDSVRAYRFSGFKGLESVVIPDTVKTIGSSAFSGCVSLKTARLPSGLESLGAAAFLGCVSLQEAVLPGSITSIGNYVFNGCSSLRTVNISDGIKTIGPIFGGCVSMQEIWLPASLTEINGYVFNECCRLEDVHYGSSEEDWNTISVGFANEFLTNAAIHFDDPLDADKDGQITAHDAGLFLTGEAPDALAAAEVLQHLAGIPKSR